MGVTAERLAEAMSARGVDQSALARRLGVTQGAISKIVLGRTANSRLLPRIATQLRVSLPWLLGETDDPCEGGSTAPALGPEEAQLLSDFRQLGQADQEALLRIVERMRGPRTLHTPRRSYRADSGR